MLVNYIQVAYVLQISTADAKLMMLPYVERLYEESRRVRFYEALIVCKKINKNDFVESSLLNQVYRHPSPMLDGKDNIGYVITTLRTNLDCNTKKR